MSETRDSYRFSGGTSFMSNGYVIWQNGLDGEKPNWFAKQQGTTYVDRMFYDRSLDQRSSFYKFTEFLSRIQQKEAIKERNFINLKLEKMRANILEKERISAVQRAIDDDKFGLAYTLLLDLDTSIQELKRELSSNKFNNYSHMNKFWNAQFSSFLQKKLEQNTEIQGHKLVKKIEASSLTIGDLVDEWMDELLSGSNGAIAQSLEPVRESVKASFLGYLQRAGIEGLSSYADDIFGTANNFTSLSGFKTTKKQKGGDKKLSHMTKLVADAIGNAVGLGMPAEIAVGAEQGKHGAISFNTGTFTKRIAIGLHNEGFKDVQQKADVTSFEVFEGSYDIEKLAKEIFETEGFNQETYKKFLAQLEEAAKNDVGQIFEVDTNVKGYRSKLDLSIEGVGSFNQRTKNLVKMAEEAEGIPAYSMEKLIFMLNNTVEGCIASYCVDRLINYIAAVCVAWMWDDYTDLFSISESGSAIQKIRMFNSGGQYYSASQIIGQTLEELLTRYKGSSFVVVDIQPPSFDADSMYRELKGHYPVPDNQNKQEWQSALKPRWDEMRDYVSTHGKISVKIQQAGIEKLIGDLSQYL